MVGIVFDVVEVDAVEGDAVGVGVAVILSVILSVGVDLVVACMRNTNNSAPVAAIRLPAVASMVVARDGTAQRTVKWQQKRFKVNNAFHVVF